MSDELLPFYDRELAFVRKMSAEFGAANPKIAGRLRIGPDGASEDPHVERMIEAFAFLNARTRLKLDSEFPEVADALLGVLYPHYLAPIPPVTVAQLSLDKRQADLFTGYRVERHSPVEADTTRGETCRFRTCYEVNLWPIRVTAASLGAPPFGGGLPRAAAGAAAVARIEMSCLGPQAAFSKMRIPSLRFFLWRGTLPQHAFLLYELLCNHVMEAALVPAPGKAPVPLGPSAARPVGFEPEEAVLPHGPRSFPGYRLLTEYFAFPDKFLFLDVDLPPAALAAAGNTIALEFYLNRTIKDLEQNVNAATFRLGCTPLVNLFGKLAEPIDLNHTRSEYRVVPDARHESSMEVYSIDRVSGAGGEGSDRPVEYQPFYSLRHRPGGPADGAYWYALRRPSGTREGRPDPGTDVFLSFVDLEFSPSRARDTLVHVETTCLNRDLAQDLLRESQPHLRLAAGGPVTLDRLTPATPALRPPLRAGKVWRLVSHLTLNYLSLDPAGEAPEALREVLRLYDFADSEDTRRKITGLDGLECRRAVFRSQPPGAFCRGLEVRVTLDEEKFSDRSGYLFASVIERFLANYCSINSFTQLVARARQRDGDVRRWPPRAGNKVLL